MEQSNFVRINFKLTPSELEIFTRQAKSLGITKSCLLRKLLENTSPESLSHCKVDFADGFATYNLRMSLDDYSLLIHTSRRARMRKGSYLRAIIRAANFSVGHIAVIRRNRKMDGISNVKMLSQIENEIDKGNLRRANADLDQLEEVNVSKYREEKIFALIDTKRAIIARHYRDLDRSKRLLNNAAEIGQITNLTKVELGQIYDQLSVINEVEEDLDNAINNAKKQMGQDIDHRGHLRFASLYSQQGEFALSRQHLDLAGELFRPSNIGSQIRFNNRRCIIMLKLGELAQAERLIHLTLDLATNAGYEKEKRYSLEALALINIYKGDFKTAIVKLQKACRLDLEFRERSNIFTKSGMLLNFANAAMGMESAIPRMAETIELQHRPIYLNLGRYYLNTARYIYSQTERDKDLGRTGLLKLANLAGNTKGIAIAARQTLQTGLVKMVI
jgi:tetratricopeptide (TPR) repeat protein